jgi:gluconokinase
MDSDATAIGTATVTQSTATDASGRREHAPDLTWRAVVRAVRRALTLAAGSRQGAARDPGVTKAIADRIVATAVTGPRGSFLVTDAGGTPRSPTVTWQDTRAGATAAELARTTGDGYRRMTGMAPDASAVLAKVLWLREANAASFSGDWRIATPQGDVLRRLGADGSVIDHTVAAHVGLLDVTSLDWSDDLLASFGFERRALPRLVMPGVVGHVGARAARDLGLRAGIPLVAAGSDGVCSELGAGVVQPGQLYAYLGTAAAVAGPLLVARTDVDPSLIVMPGSVPGRWRLLGLAMAGGSARDWAMAALGVRSHVTYDALVDASPPGAGGVAFVPTLAGAAAPEPDSRARGVFAGLSLATARGDLARAVLEGVALELCWMVETIAAATSLPSEVRLTGGASRSAAWSQIVADTLGVRVARIADPNPGLRGAAVYAWAAVAGAGVIDAAMRLDPPRDVFEPRDRYAKLYRESAEIYALLRRSFRAGGVDERLFSRTIPDGALRPS